MSIRPLSAEVIAQIKSSTSITCLNGVVVELVQNSLDAESTKIDISVDYSRGGCVVEDNGLGILPSEFGESGGLGKLYHSSKQNATTPMHGGCGTFLASLSAMAVLSISSHHYLHRSHNTVSMHNSEVVSRQVPAPAQHYLSHFDHGTRVTVRDLFGSMPVRVKQRALTSENHTVANRQWESLKRDLVLLILAWPTSVSLTLRAITSNLKMAVRGTLSGELKSCLSNVCQILSQACYIFPEDKVSWVSIRASIPDLDMSGTVSLVPSPTKYVQFISFGIQPLFASEGQSILHDEINQLFLNSAFGNEEENEALDSAELARRAKDGRYKGDGYTNKELKGGKKRVERWPMFYINIQRIQSTPSNGLNVDDILDDKGNSLTSIIELLRAMILEFLTHHNFRPRAPRGNRVAGIVGSRERASFDSILRKQHTCKPLKLAKSSPIKGASPKPTRSIINTFSQNRERKYDPFGSNIKLPSFRQSPSTPELPFASWSRVKSGNNRLGLGNNGNSSYAQEIQRPSTAPPLSTSPDLPLKPPRPLTPSAPLISSIGKVIRRPFEDVPIHSTNPSSVHTFPTPVTSSPSKPFQSQRSAVPIDRAYDSQSELVVWTNPVSKVKCFIDRRTGHTVPIINTAALRSSTRSSLNTDPSSGGRLSSSNTSFQSLEPSPWLSSLLEKWDNPVFHQTESSIPRVPFDGETEHVLHGHHHHCSQVDIDRAFKEVSSGLAGRISKTALANAEVIGQVDRKFILVNVPIKESGEVGKILVIVDQHAADERIRIEKLLSELCNPPPPRADGSPGESGIATAYLERPITFEVTSKDLELLSAHKGRFAEWGILYSIPASQLANAGEIDTRRADLKSKRYLTVRALPPAISERCKSDPKLLIDFIRTELYSTSKPLSLTSGIDKQDSASTSWLSRIHTCPPTLLNMLNSRACRSAIMFNDVLTKEQCEVLVKRLANATFPFQCAHGRPSLLPLIEVGSVPRVAGDESRGVSFGKELKKWKARMDT